MKKTIKVTLVVTSILEKTITAEVSEKVINEYMKEYDDNELRWTVCTSDNSVDGEWENPDSLELENIYIEDKHKLFGEGFNEADYCWKQGRKVRRT